MKKIKRISIENFSGIKTIAEDFTDGVNVLARPNGYGKTSLITALMFASGFLSHKAGEVESKLNPNFKIDVETLDGLKFGKRWKKKIETTIDDTPVAQDVLDKRLGVDEFEGYRVLPGNFLRDTKLTTAKKKNMMMQLLKIGVDDLRAIFAPSGVSDYDNPIETAKNNLLYRKNELDKAEAVFENTKEKFNKINSEFGGKEDNSSKDAELRKVIDEKVKVLEDRRDKLSRARIPFATAKEKLEEAEVEIKKINAGIAKIGAEIASHEATAKSLKGRYDENVEALNKIDKDGCPVCGGKSDIGKLKAKIDDKMKSLISEGKEMKTSLAELEKKKKTSEDMLEEKEAEAKKIKDYIAKETSSAEDLKKDVDDIWKEIVEKRAELAALSQDDSQAIMENLKADLAKEEKKVKDAKEAYEISNITYAKVLECLPVLEKLINEKWKNILFPKFEMKIYSVSDEGEYKEVFEMLFEHNGVMKPYSDLSNAYKKMAELEFALNTGAEVIVMDEINSMTQSTFDHLVSKIEENCPDKQVILAWAKD